MLTQTFLPLLCILFLIQIVAAKKSTGLAKKPSYQDLYLSCQNQETACVVVTYGKGYNKASISGQTTQCINDGNTGSLCTFYGATKGTISCKYADDIGIAVIGTTIDATLSANASSSYSSSGDHSSIFTASCLTKN